MSKFPFFQKKGRPSNYEKQICTKVKDLLRNGYISQKDIDSYYDEKGYYPETTDELESFFESITGEPINSDSNNFNKNKSSNLDDYDDTEDDYDDAEDDFSQVDSRRNTEAINFDPFDEPVIEDGREYTKGVLGVVQESEEEKQKDDSSKFNKVEFDENDFKDTFEEIEEDIPEPIYSNTKSVEEEDEAELEAEAESFEKEKLGGDNLQDLTPQQKRKSAEKTAEAILGVYCKFAPLPFKKWASFSENKISKLSFDDKIDLNMMLEDNVTVKDYIDSTNEQVEEIFTVSEEQKNEIKEPLIDVLLEQELALTPTQRLLMAVGSHVVTMGFSAFQLAQNNKIALESFEKYHSQNKPSQMNQKPSASSGNTVSKTTQKETKKESESDDDFMKKMIMNDFDDDDVIDPKNDPSVEVTEE